MNGNHPSFPINDPIGATPEECLGLTKREYFAALAMQGNISNPECYGGYEVYAEEAVKYADALIAALNKEPHA